MFSIVFSILVLFDLAGAASLPPRRRSTGCGQAAPFGTGEFSSFNIDTQDGQRDYAVWVPETYDETELSPLILSYHGAGGTMLKQMALDGLNNTYFNTDHIIVYLQGLLNSDGSSTWQGAPGAPGDDLGFTSAVLDQVESQFCIDTTRVYATGKSQGGGFVGGALACDTELSQRIAAFAPVSGAYYYSASSASAAAATTSSSSSSSYSCDPNQVPLVATCATPRRDQPVMAFHGGADTTIPYFGGIRKRACLPDVRHWATAWAIHDGLDSYPPANQSIPGSVAGVVTTYGAAPTANQTPAGQVTLVYDGDNIPHDWPATYRNLDNRGKNLASFNATTWIMEFFSQHTLGANPPRRRTRR